MRNAVACGEDEMPSTLGGRRETLKTWGCTQSTVRLLHTAKVHKRQGAAKPLTTCVCETQGWHALVATRWERQCTDIALMRSPQALRHGSTRVWASPKQRHA
jgi:hypothetical protein